METTNLQDLAVTSGLAHSGPEPKVQLRVIHCIIFHTLFRRAEWTTAKSCLPSKQVPSRNLRTEKGSAQLPT